MSEISENEIKSMTKEQNYMRGYKDGKSDVLDEVKAEIKGTLYVDSLIFGELIDFLNGKISADDVIEEFNRVTRLEVLKIIDKYRGESDCRECKAEHDCYECEKYEESEG